MFRLGLPAVTTIDRKQRTQNILNAFGASLPLYLDYESSSLATLHRIRRQGLQWTVRLWCTGSPSLSAVPTEARLV